MNDTSISWTNKTWNPVTGCDAASPECAHCYARSMANRLWAAGNKRYSNNFKVTIHPDVLDEVDCLKQNDMVFVCSMSDLFHPDVPDAFIDQVMDKIRSKPEAIFQILTKRSARMAEYFSKHPVPTNVWAGVTIGHPDSVYRLADLKKVQAAVRWISAEPLLGDVAPLLDLSDIDWVVVGGESGPSARPMQEEWAWNMKTACEKCGTTFMFKQWGTFGVDGKRRSKSENGRLLRGSEYQNFPTPRKI